MSRFRHALRPVAISTITGNRRGSRGLLGTSVDKNKSLRSSRKKIELTGARADWCGVPAMLEGVFRDCRECICRSASDWLSRRIANIAGRQ
jgi:hypothetical protein